MIGLLNITSIFKTLQFVVAVLILTSLSRINEDKIRCHHQVGGSQKPVGLEVVAVTVVNAMVVVVVAPVVCSRIGDSISDSGS